jgi:hypothetical protein
MAQATVGSPHGQGSGGTSGGTAGSRGSGAGGATAGARSNGGAGPSGAATSTGPGSVNQNQFGGAFPTTPTEDPTTPATTATTSVMTILNNQTEASDIVFPGRCGTHPISGMSPRQRMSGANLDFLKAAQAYLAPDYNYGDNQSGLYLLGDYQEALESVKPDAELAGLYLSLASTRPVTPEMVARVNSILCVSASPGLVTSITQKAAATAGGKGR